MTRKKRTLVHSLNNAADGFIYVLRHERNMRVHFLFGFFVLFLAIFLRVNRTEWMILCMAVAFVFVMEMVNTAVERTADLIERAFHPGVKAIKDISAGAVLVSAVNALVVGFFIFSKYLGVPFETLLEEIRRGSWQVTFIAFLAIVFVVVSAKAYFKRGTPFRGGIVSGHSAIAFSLWTTVLFTQVNSFVVMVTFLLAALVAQSRLKARIHSFWEVVSGALLGIFITTMLFQLFN